MNRKDFLKGLGLLGIASSFPFNDANTLPPKVKQLLDEGGCILIPQETAGPFPLNLSNNPDYFRQIINENKPGLPLDLTLTVVNINDNCRPIQNARIDIWHNDGGGSYSGFANQPGGNMTGQTFCRGIQLTNEDGQVFFQTIYPGWYPGRITHIHFQVFLNSVLSVTSQMAFPNDITIEVYNHELYAAHGQNTTVSDNSDDGIFADMNNTQYQILTVVPNLATGGYSASMTIGISAPVTGIINLEPETGGQFKLHQNEPNPFDAETVFVFDLKFPARTKIAIFDLSGKKVAEVLDNDLQTGAHRIRWNGNTDTGMLPSGCYIFELSTENSRGTFSQAKTLHKKK